MARALNEAKLREWMQSHAARLIALSAGICRDRHRAEEIVQEAFVKLWRRPPEGGEVVYSAWLRRVVTNLSINALQRDRRGSALPEFSDDPAMRSADQPEDAVHRREQIALVNRAMDELDQSKRAILMLRVFEGLTYEEIASHLNVPVGTVMSRLNRARAALAEAMKQLQSTDAAQHAADADEPPTFDIRRYRAG